MGRIQTTKTGYQKFPDGGKVSVLELGASSWTDLGSILSAVTFTLNWTDNQVATANAGKTTKQTREMTIDGAFTLGNLEPDVIHKMSGGLFTLVETTGAAVTTVPDITIAAGWEDDTKYQLTFETSSTDSTNLKASAKPTLTSVTLDPTGTPEVLVEGTEYVLCEDSNSPSGWSIQFISSGMSTGSPTTFEIVVDVASVTPVAGYTLHCGQSTKVLDAIALKIEHTNDDGVIDNSFTVWSANANSGGFVFGYKGANEDGLDEMPLSFTGDLDTSRDSGYQLFESYTKAAS